MSNKLLITLGCSWTFGVGVGYQDLMSEEDLKKIAWDLTTCNSLSFRGILSQKYGFINKNLSVGGSSNSKQFRLAKTFFNSVEFQKLKDFYQTIIVLWGITSTSRTELYSLKTQSLDTIFYSQPGKIAETFVKYSYNHDHEVFMLAQEMSHWNHYFKLLGIKNYWFDTFNHHDYNTNSPAINQYKNNYISNSGKDWPTWDQYVKKDFGNNNSIKSEILDITRFEFAQYVNTTNLSNFVINHTDSRDLMSQLAMSHGMTEFDSKYHASDWTVDTNRVDFLVKQKLLNPYTYHPTYRGHCQIAEMIINSIGKDLQD